MGSYLPSSNQPAGSMPRSENICRAYDEVVSLLQFLDVLLFCHHRGFDSEMKRFYGSFNARDIRYTYEQFQLLESRLADPRDNTLTSYCLIEIADTAREAREYIVAEVLSRHGWELFGRNTYQLASSTTSIVDEYTSTLMNELLRISMEDEHFVLYDLVVSLLHDLKLILSSLWPTSDSEQRFRKGDIQIMYDNLNMMHSLLIDSSGQGYCEKLMSRVENWVRFVACTCRDYIHLSPQSCIGEQSTGSRPPSSYILEDLLRKINERMENISWVMMNLTEKQEQRSDSFLHSLDGISELDRTSSADGATQISCHRITKNIEFVNNKLRRIHDGGRDIIQTSTQSLQGTTSTAEAGDTGSYLPSSNQPAGSMPGFGICRAYDEVVSLLQFLDVLLFCHHRDFDSKMKRFCQTFNTEDIRYTYGQFQLLESRLSDSSDNTLISCLSIRIADAAREAREYIVAGVCVRVAIFSLNVFPNLLILNFQVLSRHSWELFGRNMYQLATSTTSIVDECTSTMMNKLVGICMEDEHFVLYDLMVSLLYDLELILSSHWHTSDSGQRFRKEDIQNMYDNFNMMDSLLIDSSGQGYDKNFMSSVENWVRFVACRCRDYIHLWSYIGEHSAGSRPPSYILDDRLRKINERMGNISWVIMSLTEKQEQRSDSFLHSLDGISELDWTSSADGATQISCHRITKNIEFVNNQLRRIRDGGRDIIQTSTQSLQGTTSTGQVFIKLNNRSRMSNEGCKLVGFKHDLLLMLQRLTGHPPKLEVLTVVGMGGIGKTTFAESLYAHPLVRYHFHIRAWFTISQQYQVKKVLKGLLRCLTDPTTEIYEKTSEELKQKLYQRLKGKKYLIVLDDMWDKQAWNDFKGIFPNDENGSRIMLTTRLTDVAEFASTGTPPRFLPHLSPDESWELLCSKIPVNELCPPEIVPIGKQIACKCQGLPLAIVVVAGLLSNKNMTLEAWKEVAERVCSIVMEEQEQCLNILALSYNHLPEHLKPCFLYMGLFPEDSRIPTKKLIWLWIAEGFIRPRKLKSLEEVAEDYLEDLIGRSLVQVNRRRYDGRFKTCFLHDMLRDLCLRESHKQHFFLVFHEDLKWMSEVETKKFMRKCRRVCFHSSTLDTTTISWLSNTRSFLWFKTITSIDLKSCSFMDLQRLKVLDIIDDHLAELPTDIVPILSNVRYLALSFQKSIDRYIFSSTTFQRIQILIVEGEWNGHLPKEFWTMSELRHFCLKRSFLSYWPKESRPNIMQLISASESSHTLIYPVEYEEHSRKVLQNLRSLTTIRPISCTKVAFLSMPNLKKLGVFENEEDCKLRGWLKNLVHLEELQTLKYIFSDPYSVLKPDPLPSMNFILAKLINLTISGTAFRWEDMRSLCALPKLEVLKLKNHAFYGSTWTLEPEAGGFPCLKYLLIGTTNLQTWEADDTHFPKLQHLVLMKCRQLKEIPCDIFQALLLERIELHDCSETSVISAEKLQRELVDNGNDCLVLHVMPTRSKVESQ